MKNVFGTFLKNRVLHENANTPPLTKFQNFEKIQISRNRVELEAYCKETHVIIRSIRKTAKTSKKRDFFQKTNFFKMSENANISKNRKFDAS
jgi:hypothetical protein